MLQFLVVLFSIIFFCSNLFQVIVGALIYWAGHLSKKDYLKQYGRDLALAADQNMNVVWLGQPDETISSRIGRAVKSGKPKWFIKYLLYPFVDLCALAFGDKNHCLNSIEEEEIDDSDKDLWKWSK